MKTKTIIVTGLDENGDPKEKEELQIVYYNIFERFWRWITRKRHTWTLTTRYDETLNIRKKK